MLLAQAAAASSPSVCVLCEQRGVGANIRGNSDVQATADQIAYHEGRPSTVADVGKKNDGGAACPGCTYRTITLSEAQRVDRQAAAAYPSCPPNASGQRGETRLLYRDGPGGSTSEFIGAVCTVPTEDGAPVVTLGMVEAELRRLVQEVVPATTELGFAPSAGAVVNLPTIVFATPHGPIQRDFAPYGIPVRVVLTPSWEWTFEPGATRRTSSPGQPYQDDGTPVAADPAYVTHTYRTPGRRTVAVTVHWAAQYALDGGTLTPLGELTRGDTAALGVREAPSRLVAR